MDCLRLLALAARRGDVGRLGITTDSSPIVVPVNFGYWENDVLLRIGPGTLADTVPGALVALEVDDVDRREGVAWSVLVRGLARSLAPHDRHRLWEHLPEPLAPRPGDLVVSLRSDIVTGRRFMLSSTRPEDKALPPSTHGERGGRAALGPGEAPVAGGTEATSQTSLISKLE